MTISQIIKPAGIAAGVVLGAYPQADFKGPSVPTGAPNISPTATAAVQSDGTVTFTGLTDRVPYWAAPIPVAEVQTLTVDATAGNYRLRSGSNTTVVIAYNADAATTLQAQIDAILGSGVAVVTGGPGDSGGTTPYVITFVAKADVPAIEVLAGSTALSGGGATATLVTTTQGRVGGETYIGFEAHS